MPSTTHAAEATAARAVVRAARTAVEAHAPRVARLGQWPAHIAPDSLLLRLPSLDASSGRGSTGHGGFDAGLACALDLIPRDRQKLAAQLHAAYTPAAVAQVRAETSAWTADSESTWWLAACAVCTETDVTVETFAAQVAAFTALAADPDQRLAAAHGCLARMRTSYEVRDGVAYALVDGGMQGAYLAGHPYAVAEDTRSGLFFLGTFHPSLGLESFGWAQPADPTAADPERRLGRSGPVHGSRQFVKCTDQAELNRALAALRLVEEQPKPSHRAGSSGTPAPRPGRSGQ